MIGERIKELRIRYNMNQRELAEKLGVANSTLSQYETGERTPGDEIKLKLANLFNVSLDYLLGRTSIKRDPNDVQLPQEFVTPEAAIRFILEQNVIMGFGGFDINKLTDQEVMEFANELLHQLRLLSYKYKK